jgi:predicted dehydrogenase
MTEQTRLRVGIAGCGNQGGKMAQVIARTPAFIVTACADPNLDAAAKLAASVGYATFHASADDMLEKADVDMVIVATPHHVLADVSLKAIRAGKHVLAEKPIGMNEREAAQVEAAVAQAGVTYMAGYSFRYIGAWQQVAELVQAGAVGEIQAIMGNFGTVPMLSGWRASPETGGGPLLYLGSHLIDQILWLMQDDPVEVYANVRYRSDTRADETSTFQIGFARGATAQCLVTQAADTFFHNLDIYGRDGRVCLRGDSFPNYEIVVVSNTLPGYFEPTYIRPRLAGGQIGSMHVPQLEEFAQAVREHRQPSITIADGRRVLKVMDAVFASDQTGEPVQLA